MPSAVELLFQNYAAALVESLDTARKDADRTGDPFRRGQQCGYYMALFMLLNRAKSSGVDLQAVGLDDVKLDALTD